MSTDAYIQEFRSLAEAIAPETRDVPFYTLMQPDSFPSPYKSTRAYSVSGRHIALREHLESIGAWKGWGATILFVDPPSDRLQFLGLGIHELAHCLPLRVPQAVAGPTEQQRTDQLARIAAWAAADPDELTQKPWIGHGLEFVRRCLHLRHRARVWRDVTIPYQFIGCAGNFYGLSPWWRYVDAIGSEPFRLSGSRFHEIAAIQPPAAFRKLYREDVEARRAKLEKEVLK